MWDFTVRGILGQILLLPEAKAGISALVLEKSEMVEEEELIGKI